MSNRKKKTGELNFEEVNVPGFELTEDELREREEALKNQSNLRRPPNKGYNNNARRNKRF